ncbi:MAG: nucleotidyl transferase AbiEii/AbiGii toxin family protein [Pseudomonadota bacterium]
MKDQLVDLVRRAPSPLAARNTVREYLQARILEALQLAGAMIPLAFHGGTALRFLYSLPRHSEDLDFALERPGRGYDLRAYLASIRSCLAREGYALDLKISDRRTVHAAFVRFPGLLFDLRLAGRPQEMFSVKIEIDTRPPAGAGLATTVIRRHVMLHLQHHDRSSLLAGKLHALLTRAYTKGRDVYDLLWYLSDPAWPSANLALLNAALAQTGWQGSALTESTWRHALRRRLESLDWTRVVADVRPFLERPHEERLLTLAGVSQILLGMQ